MDDTLPRLSPGDVIAVETPAGVRHPTSVTPASKWAPIVVPSARCV